MKLHKVFYFSDMLAFALWGRPITGSTYRKRDFGPTSDYLLNALRELQREGAIRVSFADYFGYKKSVYTALRGADLERLTDTEQAIIRDVVDFVANQNTAKTISELSHNRAWEMTEFGGVIPYHTAFALFPTEVSPETIEWASSVASEIEAERAKRSTMVYPSLADFRSRIQATRR